MVNDLAGKIYSAVPVRLFSAERATSYLKLLKALRMLLARLTRSPRCSGAS